MNKKINLQIESEYAKSHLPESFKQEIVEMLDAHLADDGVIVEKADIIVKSTIHEGNEKFEFSVVVFSVEPKKLEFRDKAAGISFTELEASIRSKVKESVKYFLRHKDEDRAY